MHEPEEKKPISIPLTFDQLHELGACLSSHYQLYLPEEWAVDEARRKQARVPDDMTFRTKPEIALAQIRAALAAGVAPGAGAGLPGEAWRIVSWREGSNEILSSRFAVLEMGTYAGWKAN